MIRNFKYSIFIFLFCIGASSCSNRPSNVLPEEKMVDLLADMQIAEAYENTTASSSKDRVGLGKQVLAAHGVTEETLDTTLAWYGRNMDEYSQLFDKVDEKIKKKREKYNEIPEVDLKIPGNLWPYSSHLVISPLSGYESFSFSLPNPEIEKGERILLSFSLPNAASLKGTLGVEYADGDGEAHFSNFSSKKKIEIELQTDTSKTIKRLFGFMTLKDAHDLPLYIDSVSIRREPFDSLTYRSKRRTQKSFGSLIPQKIKETALVDTLKAIPEEGLNQEEDVKHETKASGPKNQTETKNTTKKKNGQEFQNDPTSTKRERN